MNYPGTKQDLQCELNETSQLQMSKKYGVGCKHVRQWLTEHNLASNYFKGIDNDALKKMLDDGESPFEIAKHFNVKTETITGRIKNQKMDIPKVVYDLHLTKKKCKVFSAECKHGIVPSIKRGDPNLYAVSYTHLTLPTILLV